MESPQPKRPVNWQFGFTGLLLVSLAVANLFAGVAYLLRARSGNPSDIAVFFCSTLLGPFVMCMLAAAVLKLTSFLNK